MQKKFTAVKLKLESLHIAGAKSDDYSESGQFIRSDTLASAIYVANAQLTGTTPPIEWFDKFKLSSAFPYYKGELFFPKPFAKLPAINDDDNKISGKAYKKIKYLGKSYFERVLKGGEGKIEKEHIKNGFVSEMFLPNENPRILESGITQRVRVNYGDDAEPFFIDKIYFGADAGLYFLLQDSFDASEKELFYNALVHLGQNGIGTDRSVGNGHFTVSTEEITIEIPEKTNAQINLGLLCPTEKDQHNILSDENSQYSLVKRSGWIASPTKIDFTSWRKNSIYMLAEGSALHTSHELSGKIVDLAPKAVGHPIFRSGKCILINANIER